MSKIPYSLWFAIKNNFDLLNSNLDKAKEEKMKFPKLKRREKKDFKTVKHPKVIVESCKGDKYV